MKRLRLMRGRTSKSCKDIAKELSDLGINTKRTRIIGSVYKGHPNHVILNWGAVSRSNIKAAYRIYNDPAAVANSANKISTLHILKMNDLSFHTVKWTEEIHNAAHWFDTGEASKVYCRTLTSASQGRGIVVAHSKEALVPAGLYTLGLDIDREVRVHVFEGKVIDFSQKKRMSSERRESEGISADEEVRNHKNGWIFAREGVEIPEEAKEVAIKGVNVIGLDFGAVDIAMCNDIPKILEINSAPGLEGTTLKKYAEEIYRLCTEE